MKPNDSGIRKSIVNLLANLHLPKEVSLDSDKVLKLNEQKSHYSLVFADKLLLRIIPKNTQYVLEFKREYESFFPKIGTLHNEWVQVQLKKSDEIISLKENIGRIFDYELERTHGDPFGCCSRYVQCSDSKRCVHEDFLLSLGCQYRINLLAGRIFYGKNMNC